MPTYATPAQLAGFLFDDEIQVGLLPQDAGRLLKRASEVISDYTQSAVYDAHTDTDLPYDAKVAATFRDAVCAQVEFWLAGDEEDDVLGPLASMSSGAGNQDMGAAQYRTTPMYLAPRAARLLRTAGLLPSAVYS